METSDHTPCVISISTVIPKKSIFRFENYWMEHQDFLPLVQHAWSAPTFETDAAKIITGKFKNLRKVLKDWQRNLSSLKVAIHNVTLVLTFFLFLEEFRDLSVPEWNFKKILEQKLTSLLRQQHTYWKQRGSIKWVTLGDASTKFFHANASIRFRRNLITSLENAAGEMVTDHNAKALLIWESFKERLGVSSFQGIQFNLTSLLQANHDLTFLATPFQKEEINNVVNTSHLTKLQDQMALILIL
jgi:hypothetical protein